MRAPRAGQAGGDAAAERCVGAKMRRLERQHLATLRKRVFDFREPRAAARGDDQLRRIIVADARVCVGGKNGAGELLAVEILAASTDDAQRLLAGGSGA